MSFSGRGDSRPSSGGSSGGRGRGGGAGGISKKESILELAKVSCSSAVFGMKGRCLLLRTIVLSSDSHISFF